MNPTIKSLYDIVPVFMQNILLSAYGIKLDKERYGGTFNAFKDIMVRFETMTLEEVENYQNRKLQKMVTHAYSSVPYYNELFKKNKLTPSDITCKEDLHKIPTMTKDIIKSNFDKLQSRQFTREQLRDGHTSGTTGKPLEVLYDDNMIGMTYAALDRQYRWAGAKLQRFGDRNVVLRGNIIVPLQQQKPPFWRYNAFYNQLFLSNFHLSFTNLPYYFEKLREFKPTVLDGYPSSLYVLAKFLLNNGETLPLPAVLTSSETLFDFQREAIESAFQCRVFDYYGHAERVVFAAECDKHEGHHLFPEYGITEIIDENQQPLTPGNEGIMVGTSLQNYGMPLLRYITNDRTSIKSVDCTCGRPFPMMEEVATKAEDLLRLSDGRLISPSVLTHPFKPLNCIDGSQLVQTELDNLLIRIIPRDDYTDEHSNYLINEFKSRLGDNMNISIEFIEELPRTKSGKFKWVVSEVDLGI